MSGAGEPSADGKGPEKWLNGTEAEKGARKWANSLGENGERALIVGRSPKAKLGDGYEARGLGKKSS